MSPKRSPPKILLDFFIFVLLSSVNLILLLKSEQHETCREGVYGFQFAKKFNLQAMSNVLTVKLNTEENEKRGNFFDPTLAVFLMRKIDAKSTPAERFINC